MFNTMLYRYRSTMASEIHNYARARDNMRFPGHKIIESVASVILPHSKSHQNFKSRYRVL